MIAGLPLFAASQADAGAGNRAAVTLAAASPMVQSAWRFLGNQAKTISDPKLKAATLDAILNPGACVAHRAGLSEERKTGILKQLSAAGLLNVDENTPFPGGIRAGVFPPLREDGTACPKLPQTFFSAPGGAFGGHHSYPGGLVIHEAANETSALRLADSYRRVYGHSGADGFPAIAPAKAGAKAGIYIDQDLIIAAPIWHDWAKTMVFQWNADGTEFQELNFGGNSRTDNYGKAGNSATGAHHILSAAEAIKRGLSPEFVITQLSAHSAPTLGNGFKVVNWIRAAAIVAQVDPVARGFLYRDEEGRLRLPPVRRLGSMHLVNGSPDETNLLAEYALHNLSDADFTLTGPAVAEVEQVLRALAPRFGHDSSNRADYNNKFRNPVLSYLTAERLLIIYSNRGTEGIVAEIRKLGTRVTGRANPPAAGPAVP